ncbi:MAG: EF-P lysine aminoacylase EpmA [Gammaproteobacteria bacterium]
MSWEPTASIHHLKQRARIIAQIRDFFAKKNVLEVETPILGRGTIPDPNIQSISTQIKGCHNETFYLQTSPEFPMKRLLCAGIGSIYQICKAFRDGEAGTRHNPEFTMLEWYREGFDHHALMDEIDELLAAILNLPKSKRFSYREVFLHYLDIDPFTATIDLLKQCAEKQNLGNLESLKGEDKDTWLTFLISYCIEPKLGFDAPVFIYDFPPNQAALARIRNDKNPVAERFELFIQGMELANGFHELGDANEQRMRFENDLKKRAASNQNLVAIDENLLVALSHGFPECAGVAIGVDRIMMLATKTKNIADVIAFPVTHV